MTRIIFLCFKLLLWQDFYNIRIYKFIFSESFLKIIITFPTNFILKYLIIGRNLVRNFRPSLCGWSELDQKFLTNFRPTLFLKFYILSEFGWSVVWKIPTIFRQAISNQIPTTFILTNFWPKLIYDSQILTNFFLSKSGRNFPIPTKLQQNCGRNSLFFLYLLISRRKVKIFERNFRWSKEERQYVYFINKLS